MGLEENLPSGFLLTSVEKLAGTARKNSLWPASFGLACYPHDAKDKHELLAEADRCLFQSKARGKNRITVLELEEAA